MSLPIMKKAGSVKNSQWKLVLSALAIGMVVTYAISYIATPAQKKTVTTLPASNLRMAPKETEEEHFKALFESRVRALEEELTARKNKEREISEQIISLRADRDNLRKELAASKKKETEGTDGWPPEAQLTTVGPKGKLPPAPARGTQGFTAGSRGPAQGMSAQPAPEAQRAPRLTITQVGAPAGTQQKVEVPSQALTYLPSGTFAKARLLNGVLAPTRGQANGNPVPLVMQLTDDAVMPNLYRSGIKYCMITANATGELSSERVLVRLDRLSCIDDKGGAIDTKIQGYASGEDGKTGLRARLVTKSGQAIANALLTGTLSGLGKAVSIAAEETNTSIVGNVTTSVKNPYRAGIGQGASHAMDRITDYYLKLASDLFPVLEVDSGREIEIVISQGLSIERLKK